MPGDTTQTMSSVLKERYNRSTNGNGNSDDSEACDALCQMPLVGWPEEAKSDSGKKRSAILRRMLHKKNGVTNLVNTG
jgi:hypothetical protein